MSGSRSMPRSTPRSIPLWKMVIFSLIPLLSVEILIRLVAFVIYGFSAYFLLYGFTDAYIDHAEEGHTATYDGYFKFPPSRELKQYGMFAEATPIQINNHGFRGVDFESEKADGAFRVVCMGGSSTFGFYNRDAHTYPAVLGARLAATFPDLGIEVINAGVPHMNTDNIDAMLQGEILAFEPDVVTLYSAFNDAGEVKDEIWAQSASRWLHGHVASYVALKRVLEALGGPILHSLWSEYLAQSDADYVQRQISLHLPGYRRNVERFVDLVRSAGAEPLLIRQPMTTLPGDPAKQGLAYDEEIGGIRTRLEQNGWVKPHEVTMLVHVALVSSLDRIAAEKNVAVIDNIEIMDRDAGFFASYVHLSERGNEALASALEERLVAKIRERQNRAPSAVVSGEN